jgi:hypothetical protein
MTNTPKALTAADWKEIAALPLVRDAWGLDEDDPGTESEILGSMTYGAKFDFVSGSPGYVGELFILIGDSLDVPLVLSRDTSTGELKVEHS